MKNKIISILVVFMIVISICSFTVNADNALAVHETDINLNIENLTRGCEVYLYISENMFEYNMQKFISNNIENDYTIEKEKAQKIQEFLDKKDFIGYIEYFKEVGFAIDNNEMELRHYTFCLGTSEILGYEELDGINYIKFRIYPNKENKFKLIMKDYLDKYDRSSIRFLIDEYGIPTWINPIDTPYTTNSEYANITECNINFQFMTNEDFNSIERAIKMAYLIIFLILAIIILTIIIILIKKHKRKKEEIEERKFWKKKLTKEEKKELKKKAKEQKKQERKNKNRKRK